MKLQPQRKALRILSGYQERGFCVSTRRKSLSAESILGGAIHDLGGVVAVAR